MLADNENYICSSNNTTELIYIFLSFILLSRLNGPILSIFLLGCRIIVKACPSLYSYRSAVIPISIRSQSDAKTAIMGHNGNHPSQSGRAIICRRASILFLEGLSLIIGTAGCIGNVITCQTLLGWMKTFSVQGVWESESYRCFPQYLTYCFSKYTSSSTGDSIKTSIRNFSKHCTRNSRNPAGILPEIYPGNGILFKIPPEIPSGEFHQMLLRLHQEFQISPKTPSKFPPCIPSRLLLKMSS